MRLTEVTTILTTITYEEQRVNPKVEVKFKSKDGVVHSINRITNQSSSLGHFIILNEE